MLSKQRADERIAYRDRAQLQCERGDDFQRLEGKPAAPIPDKSFHPFEFATRRRAQGAALQELADSYDRSISTMRRATRAA